MKRDVAKLRSLRKEKKSLKQGDFSPYKQTPEEEKLGIERYKQSLTLLNTESIFERTNNWLQAHKGRYSLTKNELTLWAKQYIENYSGCPFTGAPDLY